MKIVFSGAITDLEGKPMEPKKGETFTLARCAVEALLGEFQEDAKTGGEEKMKRYSLATRIYEAGDQAVELTAGEVQFIKDRIAKGYGALVVGKAWAMLEGNNG